MIELVNKMPIKKCPVCGNTVLWLKEVRKVDDKYRILFKCDNCAYVNTTLPCIVEADKQYMCGDYMQLGILVNTAGYVETIERELTHRPIGRYFWFDEEMNLTGKAKCPHCGEELEVIILNPFVRYNQYRCDVIARCKNNHTVAFGVHVTQKEFELLKIKGGDKGGI